MDTAQIPTACRPSANTPARLLLVDDHNLVREGVRRILGAYGDPWHVDEAASGFQALSMLRQFPYQVVLVDLGMPGLSGLDLMRRIKAEFPAVKTLVLTMHAEHQYALRAFKAGAQGYLTKDCASAELLAAVRKVLAGGIHVSAALAEQVVLQFSGAVRSSAHAQLSDRELDVLRGIVAGQRLTDIARRLHLSIKTVSTHKGRIQDKLGLSGTAGLVRYGLEHRLMEAPVLDGG